MNKTNLVLPNVILALFLIFIDHVAASSLESYIKKRERVPVDKFQNQDSAVSYGCEVVTLKDPNHKSCVLEHFEGQTLQLIVYDMNNAGEFIKTQTLCVPSWYNRAEVKYRDLLGDGRQFVFVEFEGLKGTGTLQMILMIIGWHEGRFVSVLLETTEFYLSEKTDLQKLKLTYKIENVNTPKVSILMNYEFEALDEGKYPYEFTARWTETLSWNEDRYIFYNEEAEQKKYWNVPCSLQKNIAKVRLTTKDIDVTKLCEELFRMTTIELIMKVDEFCK